MLSVGKRDQHGSIRDSAFRVYSYIEAPEAASIHRVGNGISKYQVIKISASTDGGPRSRVCARETLRSAPHRRKQNFFAACVQNHLQTSQMSDKELGIIVTQVRKQAGLSRATREISF